MAAHSFLPLDATASAFVPSRPRPARSLAWPGHSRVADREAIADAPALLFHVAGFGKIVTGHRVTSAAELSDAKLVLFDTGPQRQFAADRRATGSATAIAAGSPGIGMDQRRSNSIGR